ncbi:MAG: transketolase C-terminal domain-containing protein [Armatimonadota bacterium]|nr:transketolase C-terminal domain-containing protein [Armatimonadota bacterium]
MTDVPLHELEMRKVYALTLVDLADSDPDIVVVEADLGKASGTIPTYSEAHPERFIDAGVAEADMIGIGAGLAVDGMIPFCASFTCFATRRVYDQVTISVAYADANVKIVGTAPGITTGANGGTHMCFQDLAIMRAMPNMVVFSPCDVYELSSCVRWMAQYGHPAYMQMIRPVQPQIFDDDYVFDPETAVQMSEGDAATLVSTGWTTQFAKQAAEELAEEGVAADHLHYASVKPFDEESLLESARKTGWVVTVENQSVIGGLGGAVCEVLCERLPTPVKRLGVHDQFGEVATEQYLLNKHNMNVEHIKQACKQGEGGAQ